MISDEWREEEAHGGKEIEVRAWGKLTACYIGLLVWCCQGEKEAQPGAGM